MPADKYILDIIEKLNAMEYRLDVVEKRLNDVVGDSEPVFHQVVQKTYDFRWKSFGHGAGRTPLSLPEFGTLHENGHPDQTDQSNM